MFTHCLVFPVPIFIDGLFFACFTLLSWLVLSTVSFLSETVSSTDPCMFMNSIIIPSCQSFWHPKTQWTIAHGAHWDQLSRAPQLLLCNALWSSTLHAVRDGCVGAPRSSAKMRDWPPKKWLSWWETDYDIIVFTVWSIGVVWILWLSIHDIYWL